MNKVMLMMLAILGLLGCTSIEQPVAKVPLVTPLLQKSEPLALKIVEALEGEGTMDAGSKMTNVPDSEMESTVTHQKSSPVFYSARGQFCRFLSDGTTRKLYCKHTGGDWFAVPAVLSDMQALEETLTSPFTEESEKGDGND